MNRDEKTKIIVDDTSIYEIDLECSRCSERTEKTNRANLHAEERKKCTPKRRM